MNREKEELSKMSGIIETVRSFINLPFREQVSAVSQLYEEKIQPVFSGSSIPTKVDHRVPADWKLLLTHDEIQQGVRRCARVIDQNFEGRELVMLCILKGAVPFFVSLTQEMNTEHSWYFLESSSYHDKQTQLSKCNIMGSIEPSKFKNKYVVLVDELYDNGLTISQVKKAVMEKAEVPEDKIFTCTLFKKDKKTEYDPPNLYGITLPNVWCNGFGLDSMQKMRNLKDLYAAPKEEGVPKTADDALFDDDAYYQTVRRKLLEQLN